MRPTLVISLATLVTALVAVSCSRFGPVYPSRPVPSDTPPLADPQPARVVVHVVVTGAAMRAALEDAVPHTGEGTFPMLGADRHYTWERGSLDVGFTQGRVVLTTKVHAHVALPLERLDVPLDLRVETEPVVTSEYAVRLQSVEVHVASTDVRLLVADKLVGVYGKIGDAITTKLKDFDYDLRPLLAEAYTHVSRPITLPMGEASACATLKVLEVEAGPTVLADGLEKDLALVVAPSITLPCADLHEDSAPELPPFSNVASIASGPFTVTIPIAARYDELSRAMALAFTEGKLFFSSEYPQLYVEKPEVYESAGALVLKLHLAGPVHKMGIDADLDGDLFLTGHAAVIDNELTVPDLEPTIETRSFLLSLKAMTDGDRIRDQCRAALRLDIGARLQEARSKLGDGLTFGDPRGCFRGDVDRVEVTGVYPHAAYLRIYVAVTARARAMVPCPVDAH